MAVITSSRGRNPAIVTGIVGTMLGLVLGIGLTLAASFIGGSGVAERDGSAVALSQAQVFAALREHSVREYGALSGGVSRTATADLQQQHLAREYGAISSGAGPTLTAELQQQHLAREYGAASGNGSIGSSAEQLHEHTLRENAAP